VTESLSAEQRRALEVLDRIPHGAAEALMFSHGFRRETLAGLVLAGLATVVIEAVRAGGPPVMVERMLITDAGRDALAAEG
jgi:hypothetical protein